MSAHRPPDVLTKGQLAGNSRRQILIEQALSSISNGLFPLVILATAARAEASIPLYIYSFYTVAIVVYRSFTGIPSLVIFTTGDTDRDRYRAALRREVVGLVVLGAALLAAGLLAAWTRAEATSTGLLLVGACLVLLAGDACRYAYIAAGTVTVGIAGNGIWVLGFGGAVAMNLRGDAHLVTLEWFGAGVAGSALVAGYWLFSTSRPNVQLDYAFRFRLASATELGVDRLTTGLSEAGVGLLSGPVGVALIQLGRTLWSPLAIIFTTIQATATREIGSAPAGVRPSAMRQARKQSFAVVLIFASVLLAAALALPDGVLHSTRLERVLAISVAAVYFVAFAYGLAARVMLRILRRMRTLVLVQTIGGVTGLLISIAAALVAPWYVAILLGNAVRIAIAWTMNRYVSRLSSRSEEAALAEPEKQTGDRK